MINIDFNIDPSTCVFVLDNNYASAYLIAKAAQHYGADNIDVAVLLAERNNPADVYRERAIHSLIGKIGVNHARMVSLNNKRTVVELKAMMRATMKAIEPTWDDALVDFKVFARNKLQRELTAVMLMGLVDGDFNPIPNPTMKTLVLATTANDEYSKTSVFAQPVVAAKYAPAEGEQPMSWSPLTGYTEEDILASAAEEGLSDLMTLVMSCEHTRPLHCGQCDKCLTRRHKFIQAGIDDTTHYEYR